MQKKIQKSSFNRIHFSSKTVKWNTPDEIFNELDQEFHFVFDPCVPPRVGDFQGDGLRSKWFGNTFCNMPYDDRPTWIEHGWEQICEGNSELIVFLIPLRYEESMKFLHKRGAEFRLCNKRITFGDVEDVAPFDSLIAILRKQNVIDYWNKLGIS